VTILVYGVGLSIPLIIISSPGGAAGKMVKEKARVSGRYLNGLLPSLSCLSGCGFDLSFWYEVRVHPWFLPVTAGHFPPMRGSVGWATAGSRTSRIRSISVFVGIFCIETESTENLLFIKNERAGCSVVPEVCVNTMFAEYTP